MAGIDFDGALKQDLIPNDPKILDEIKKDTSGQLFEKVKKNYASFKSSSSKSSDELPTWNKRNIGGMLAEQEVGNSSPDQTKSTIEQIKKNVLSDADKLNRNIGSSLVNKEIRTALDKDELPFDKNLLAQIEQDPSGQFLGRVKQRYAEYKSNPNPDKAKFVFKSWDEDWANKTSLTPDQVPSAEAIIQQKVKTFKIPNDPYILDQIRSGKVDISKIEKNYANYLGKNPIVKIGPNGEINPTPALQRTAITPEKVDISSNEFFNSPSVSRSVLSIDPRVPKEFDTGQPITPDQARELTIKLQAQDKTQTQYDYLAKRFTSGATFSIYDPKIDAPDSETAKLGVVFNLAGSVPTSFGAIGLIGKIPGIANLKNFGTGLNETVKELKNAKLVAKTIGNTEELSKFGRALTKTRLLKAGVDVTAITTESGALGFSVGAIKSAIQNNPVTDVLKDGLTEGALYAALGNLLYPVTGAGGALFSAFKDRRAANVLKAVATEPGVQDLAKSTSSNFLNKLRTTIPENSVDQLAADAIKKIDAIKPMIGTQSALIAHPEILASSLKDRAATLSDSFFGNQGILKPLLNQSPELQVLVSTGKHLEALDTVQASMTNFLRKNQDAKEYVLAPFLNNSQTLNKVYAERLLKGVTNPDQYPTLKSNVLNYLDDPNPQNRLILEQNAPKRFFQRIESQKFRDPRLNPREIDQMVGDVFQDALNKTAGNEAAAIPEKIFGKLKTTDDILKSAVTFNRELSRTFIQAYAQNPSVFEDNFLKAKPELIEGVRQSVNMRRITLERNVTLTKRREVSLAITDLQQKITSATETDLPGLQAQLALAKDKSKTLSAVLTRQNADIRNINLGMQGTRPEQLDEINQFVSDIYTPRRSGEPFGQALDKRVEMQSAINSAKRDMRAPEATDDLRGEMLGKIREARIKYRMNSNVEQAQQYAQKFGAGDNPYFVRADSELADVMNAFMVAGQDIRKEAGKGFAILDNPRRQINRELGHNNVVEKFFEKIQERDGLIADSMKKFNAMIDSIGIKAGSKESGLLQQLGEGRMTPSSSEFMSLSPKTQEKLIKGNEVARKYYDDVIDTVNSVMKDNNLPEIQKRSDYFFHFNETMESLPKRITNFMKGVGEEVDFAGKGTQMFWKQKAAFDPNRTVFQSEKARSGGEFIDDAITGMKSYLRPALERVYYTDLVRELDTARHFAPDNLGTFLQGIKESYLLKSPNPVDQELTSGVMRKLMDFYRAKLGKGAILYNANTSFQNLMSVGQNFAISPMHGMKATLQMASKEGREIASLSKNLKVRDAINMEIDTEGKLFSRAALREVKGIGKGLEMVKATSDTVGKAFETIGGFALKTFDGMAAKHAFLTGYSRARSLGLNQEQAVNFADKWTGMIQNSNSKINQSRLYQSTLAKSFFQFSSFVNNYAATISNDLPNIARSDGAAKAVQMIIRSVAGMSIANETARSVGAPAPFDIDTFIPFLGNFRYGSPGLIGGAFKAIEAVVGDDQRKEKANKDLKRMGASLAVPGGGQAFKTINAITDKNNPNDDISGYIFGKKKRETTEQKVKERKKWLNRTRQSVRESVDDLIGD